MIFQDRETRWKKHNNWFDLDQTIYPAKWKSYWIYKSYRFT